MVKKRDRVMKIPSSPRSKVAIHRAFPSIVGINTYDVPGDMARAWKYADPCKFLFQGHGIIIESEVSSDNATYITTIIAPAMLFKRTNGINPQQVEFDVRASDGKLYKGAEVLYCDFHYNLAAITIISESPLKPSSLRALTDISSINIAEHPQSHGKIPFQIGRHSNLFKVEPGTKIIVLNTFFTTPFSYKAACGTFSAIHRFHDDCKELYWVDCAGGISSGAVINLAGEVLGILFDVTTFLPSNFVLRWWDQCKRKGEFFRPWVGVEVANLVEARMVFLEQFKNAFSELGIGTGVIVTKVEKDTPAYRSGIMLKDVIMKCNGKRIESKMEFFESMWDNAGSSVELTVLRSSDGQELNLSMSIEETPSPKFNQWMLPSILTYK